MSQNHLWCLQVGVECASRSCSKSRIERWTRSSCCEGLCEDWISWLTTKVGVLKSSHGFRSLPPVGGLLHARHRESMRPFVVARPLDRVPIDRQQASETLTEF